MRRLVAASVCVLLLILSEPAPPYLSSVQAQPGRGDWTVTGEEVVENKSIVLNGNLTVRRGASLTLRNVTVLMNPQYRGQYGILVEPGGSMYVYSSKITSANLDRRYTFIVDGNNFVLENSELHAAGWCSRRDPNGQQLHCDDSNKFTGSEGLIVKTANALIKGNLISRNGIGLILGAPGALVQGNNVTLNDLNHITITSQFAPANNNVIKGNSFHEVVRFDSSMIYVDGARGNTIENNTFTYQQFAPQYGTFAVWIHGSSNNTVTNNRISSDSVVWIYGSNNIITNNAAHYCEQGISVDKGAGNRIEGNQFYPVLYSNGHTCGGAMVTLLQARNSTVANNGLHGMTTMNSFNTTYFYNPRSSIYVIESSGSFILNNNLSFVGSEPSLYLFGSDKNKIGGNIISNWPTSGWAGLFLHASNNNVITNNQVNTSAAYSIALDGSKGNLVYGNNFYSKFGRAYDDGDNSWSYNDQGNYWRGYNGTGPFEIPPNGTDNNPLARPIVVQKVAVPLIPPAIIRNQYAGPLVNMVISNQTVIANISTEMKAGGITIQRGGNLTIENSTISFGTYGHFGIFVHPGGFLNIKRSHITWGQVKLEVQHGGNATIENSIVTAGTVEVVSIAFDGSLAIVQSVIQGATDGYGFVMLTQKNGSLLITNSKLINGGPAGDSFATVSIYAHGAKLVLENSLVKGSYGGVFVYGLDASVRIVNNTFVNVGYAVSIPSVKSASVLNNTIHSQALALIVTAASISVSGNVVMKSWTGGVGVICGETFYSNVGCISNKGVSGNRVFSAQRWGMTVNTNNTVIASNTVTNAISGDLAIHGNNNIISGNTIMNSKNGLNIDGIGNVIYHNNFINNSIMHAAERGSNAWDHHGEGNYWSGYRGRDRGDGIGNMPYSIAGSGSDRYPFVKPNGWLLFRRHVFDVVADGQLFRVGFRTNSTVRNFLFSQAEKLLAFTVEGPPSTRGFASATIPTKLLGGPFAVTIEGTPLPPVVTTNATHAVVLVTYGHSVQTVRIIGTTVIPEFPAVVWSLMLGIALVLFILCVRRKATITTGGLRRASGLS